MRPLEHDPGFPSGCDACALGRRAFVVRAAQSVAAAVGLAAVPSMLRALPPAFADAPSEERRYPMPAADGVSVDDDESVIVARTAGRVYAFSLACPHKRTALRWKARDGRFECPKHKSRYHPDGVFISGRATRSMDRYAVRREGDVLVVDLSRLYREDRDAASWRAAVVQP